MPNIQVKLFRYVEGRFPVNDDWLRFAPSVVAVPLELRKQSVRSLVEQLTSHGASQVVVTPNMFAELLDAMKMTQQVDVTSIELPPEASDEERETVDRLVENIRYGLQVKEEDWKAVSEILFAYPPIRAEAIVGKDGPGDRSIILSNGIIQCGDKRTLEVLGMIMQPVMW